MSVKLEHPHVAIYTCKGTYQKYNFVVEKITEIVKKTTDYRIIHIEGLEPDSEMFKVISEIIINELKI